MTDVATAPPAESADHYERLIGRWSRKIAPMFLASLGVPPGAHWLDIGCGTGAVTQNLLFRCQPAAVHAVDPAPELLAMARGQCADPRVTFYEGTAEALPLPDDSVHIAVSGLLAQLVPLPAYLAEARRVVVSGGMIAAYVWDYAGRMDLLRRFWDAAAELHPEARRLDQGARFANANPQALQAAWEAAGLEDVGTRPIDAPIVLRDFDDYWEPFLQGRAPAARYCQGLTDEARAALRERLRATLPAAADGSLAMMARAWAVKGLVP